MSHKAVVADGKRSEGPSEYMGKCLSADGGVYSVELLSDPPRELELSHSLLWQWAVAPSMKPKRLSGDAVRMEVGDRCIVAIWDERGGEVESVQLLRRMAGRIADRASAVAGQIEPDEAFRAVAGSRLFLKVSEILGAHQLPPLGERVEFVLAPNPERADRLWASEVTLLNPSALAALSPGRKTGGAKPEPPSGTPLAPSHGGGASARGAAAAGPARVKAESSPVGVGEEPVRNGYLPGRRIYVGNLPPEVTWRELGHFFTEAKSGPLLHVVTPLDARGRPRGFGVVELPTTEAAAAALRAFAGGAELRGSRVIARDDTALVQAAGSTTVYVSNLAPTTTWQALAEHLRMTEGAAQVPVDGSGRPMGFAMVVLRDPSAAEAMVEKHHHSSLDGRNLFLRVDCDTTGRDALDAAALAEVLRTNVLLMNEVLGWVETAAPLLPTAWSEGHASPWLGEALPPEHGGRPRSLEWSRLAGWLTASAGYREDASMLLQRHERHFGAALDWRAHGFANLHDLLSVLPSLRLETHGSRLLVSVDERGGEAEPARGDRPKRPRDGAPGHHKGSGEERGRERREHGQEDRHKRHRPPDERGRPRDAQRRENARGRDGRPRGPR